MFQISQIHVIFSNNFTKYSPIYIIFGINNLSEQQFLPMQCYASAGISSRHVSMSFTCQYCLETVAWTELIFCIQVSLNLCYAVYLQNKGTPIWNFVPNSGLRKFHHGTPTVSKLQRAIPLQSLHQTCRAAVFPQVPAAGMGRIFVGYHEKRMRMVGNMPEWLLILQ